MIACTEQLISEYVDGDLSPSLTRVLEQHFRACAPWRAVLLDYCLLVAATHLLAVKRQRTSRLSTNATSAWRRNVLGQARTSDLLA
jgi:anti-sigma factor RsiW